MNAPRLILKQPTGWLAAGREVAQAMVLLSDGAFKLYLHLCLQADRHSARAVVDKPEWMQVLRKDPAWVEACLGELYRDKVCEDCGDGVEICDRFWPYQKAAPLGCRGAGGGVRQAGADGSSETGLRALGLQRRGGKAGAEPVSARGVAGTSTPGHLAGMRPKIRGHAEWPNAAAHHQPGLLRVVNRGGQSAPDSRQLLGPYTAQNGGNGKALAANRQLAASRRRPSGTTITARNALISSSTGRPTSFGTAPHFLSKPRPAGVVTPPHFPRNAAPLPSESTQPETK